MADTIEVVINNDWGHFALSDEVFARLIELGWTTNPTDDLAIIEVAHDNIKEGKYSVAVGPPKYTFVSRDIYSKPELRSDPRLVQAVKELGSEANGYGADLKIIEIPANIKWHVCGTSDGIEWIAEDHRTWSYEDKPGEYY